MNSLCPALLFQRLDNFSLNGQKENWTEISYQVILPEELKDPQNNIEIIYGFHPTPLGVCFLALIDDKIFELDFTRDSDTPGDYIKLIQKAAPYADLRENQEKTGVYAAAICNSLPGGPEKKINLLLRGTPFQIQVWDALLKIPAGKLVSYSAIANFLDNPGASRAVGSAIGKNNISYVIPCHRVINKGGEIGNYRWGRKIKQKLLELELKL